MTRTQAERSEATRARLLAAARALFAERGYAAVSTEEVVRAAAVTRGALYHHFKDKRDLLRAVHEQIEAELVQGLAEQLLGIEDTWELLVAGVDAFLDRCLDPAVTRIALDEAPSVLGWREWREIDARHGLGLVTAVIERAMAEGVIERRPVAPLAHLIMSAFGEAGLLIGAADDPRAARDEVREALMALVAGLRARGG